MHKNAELTLSKTIFDSFLSRVLNVQIFLNSKIGFSKPGIQNQKIRKFQFTPKTMGKETKTTKLLLIHMKYLSVLQILLTTFLWALKNLPKNYFLKDELQKQFCKDFCLHFRKFSVFRNQ